LVVKELNAELTEKEEKFNFKALGFERENGTLKAELGQAKELLTSQVVNKLKEILGLEFQFDTYIFV
jgi:hypothetical protein